MHIRTKTKPAFYVHEIRGVVFISWVLEKDRVEAMVFPSTNVDRWRDILSEMAEVDLEVIGIK